MSLTILQKVRKQQAHMTSDRKLLQVTNFLFLNAILKNKQDIAKMIPVIASKSRNIVIAM